MAFPPDIIFSELILASGDPSGVRHLDLPPASGGNFRKNLSTDPSGFLDFGSLNLNAGKQESPTKVFIARVGDFQDATEAVFNMRFWLPDISDFSFGTFKFNGFPSGSWLQNSVLTESSGVFVSTTLPSGQNIWRNVPGIPFDRDSVLFQEITASGADDQVTMYEYMSVTINTNAAIKVYGGDGGGFTYRLTFDFR